MTESQLKHFTTNAASAFSQSQREALSSDQRYALDQAVTGVQYTKRNSAKAVSCGMDQSQKKGWSKKKN